MEEYLASTDQSSGDSHRVMSVRDRMTPARPFAPEEASGFLARMLQRVTYWHAKPSRLSLYDLSTEQLADIGLSRAEAYEETSKAILSRWTRSL